MEQFTLRDLAMEEAEFFVNESDQNPFDDYFEKLQEAIHEVNPDFPLELLHFVRAELQTAFRLGTEFEEAEIVRREDDEIEITVTPHPAEETLTALAGFNILGDDAVRAAQIWLESAEVN
jgi:hypothetical protein